ncbi:MAG: hypothetical protein V4498_10635 [candidate division FCPU426 bacterium]
MQFKRSSRYLATILLAFATGTATVNAAEAEATSSSQGRAGIFGLSGDAGFYTYGVNGVNDQLHGTNTTLNGGMGYGVAGKFNLTNTLAAKVGIDYLYASAPASRIVNGTRVNSQVNLPATMVFIGGEYVFLPLPALDLKLIGGYTLVNIFNGHETGTNGYDMGAITGSGSGAQVGAGAELFLGRGFSIETDLAYNFARIDGATFAGAPADPNSTSSNGTVDYSGVTAKVAFTIYLIP